jgi:peptidoglycan/LPS O-acetylase OafA/YrhL
MDELLFALLEIFGEVLLQFFAEALFDLISRAVAEVFRNSEIKNRSAFAGYALLGVFAGAVSVFLLPHPLFHPARIRGVSLLISPLLTGALMAIIGSMLRRHDRETVRIESFACGAIFAFGMALVRLLFTK